MEPIKEKRRERYADNPESEKENKRQKYSQNKAFREKKKNYALQCYRRQNKILKIVSQNFECHDSGLDFLCISCLRLNNKSNTTKYRKNINEDRDKKLLLTMKTMNCDGQHYLCKTCKPGLNKGWPRLNFIKTQDLANVGSIPYDLPDLNLLESYLLKLSIPFIRVSHIPRSPNLKLLGGSVCIQANLEHTIGRLKICSENIIPVSFKRKLEYKGHYLEQVINKNKVFLWLKFLKQVNHLYKDIEIEVSDEIDFMSAELMDELVTFDEFRILKDQLAENKEKEEKIITEDINADSSDSEKEDDENYGETAKTEALGNVLLISLVELKR